MCGKGVTPRRCTSPLLIEDIQCVTDQLKPVDSSTAGADGYVSQELRLSKHPTLFLTEIYPLVLQLDLFARSLTPPLASDRIRRELDSPPSSLSSNNWDLSQSGSRST
jgi:hypothetical protein